MDYKGYRITAAVIVDEGWDFREDSDGTVTLTTVVDRSRVDASSDINYFTIEDPEGYLLDIRTLSPAAAKEFIDSFVKENDQLLRSDCHHAAVWRDGEDKDYHYICTICGKPCDIEETN